MVHALRTILLATETFPTEHIMDQRTLLNPVRRLASRKVINMLEFSTRRNAIVETIFQRKLQGHNLSVTCSAVGTGPRSVAVETEWMFIKTQVVFFKQEVFKRSSKLLTLKIYYMYSTNLFQMHIWNVRKVGSISITQRSVTSLWRRVIGRWQMRRHTVRTSLVTGWENIY